AWDHTDFSKLLVYNGPFLLAAMNPDSIELRRNPRYFREGLPYLDRVFFRTIPDTPSLLVQLQAGEVDVMENVPPGEVRRLEASARHRIVRFPDRYYGYIGWNTARAPLDRPAVRRALTMAIDRQAIVEGLLWGAARIAVSPILSLFWIHDQGLQPHPFDPKAAAGLLAREGWLDRDGDGWADRSGQPFRIGLLVNQGDPLREDIAVLVQDQLARIGVRVSIRTLEWGVFRQVREEGDFDGYVSAWLASTKVDLKNLLHSAAIGEGGYNYVRYANPEVDSLIDRARASRDFAAAIPLWRRVEGILHEEQPYTLLFERDRINAISSRLRNVRMDTNSGFSNLEEWWIVQP
ncbi:MAG: hypothetical protein HY509_01350, partial [Acidobacteria bacterium]|nr:hypothetical protein [Acidobacteriota bacterium]